MPKVRFATRAEDLGAHLESGTIFFPKLNFEGEVHDLAIRKNGFAFDTLTVADTSLTPLVFSVGMDDNIAAGQLEPTT